MSTHQLDPSVQAVVGAIERGEGVFHPDLITLHPALQRILAEGRPAPADELAAATGRSTQEMMQIIDSAREMEVDRHHRVLGMAITLLPTLHRIQLPGRSHALYSWCVPDALGAARILDQRLQVSSTCPQTGHSVVLDVEPDGISAADPATAVMSWVSHFDPDDGRASACGHMNLFVSEQAAVEFQAGYPHVINVPIDDVFEFLTPVFDAFVARATARA